MNDDAMIEHLQAEINRLTPYVAAFRREEERADKTGQEADHLRDIIEGLEKARDEWKAEYFRRHQDAANSMCRALTAEVSLERGARCAPPDQ
jgi:hypothetical protein